MNVQEKINKMENCRGKNHDLLEFRAWLTKALPQHIQLGKEVLLFGYAIY